MHRYTATVLAVLFLWSTICSEGETIGDAVDKANKFFKNTFIGTKVEDPKTIEMVQKEIASINDIAELDHLVSVNEQHKENGTIYEIRYIAKNKETCGGTLEITKSKEDQHQKSYYIECAKEHIKKRSLHNILDHDTPMFGDNDKHKGKGPKSRRRKKKKRNLFQNLGDYDHGNVKEMRRRNR